MTQNKKLKIVIVDGGLAGWLSAAMLAKAWGQGVEILLLDSQRANNLYFGDSSTSALSKLFAKLGIQETEWMPKCNATYKVGTTFSGWSKKPGFQSYFHSFGSDLDLHTVPRFKKNTRERAAGTNLDAHPDRFFISSTLARKNLAPKATENFPFDVDYGYHFDADLLARFLREKAIIAGVRERIGVPENISLNDNGSISCLHMEDGERLYADIFIDTSGDISHTYLKIPFVSYEKGQPNNAIIKLSFPFLEQLPSQTLVSAMDFGWSWQVPLANALSCAYVFDRNLCSPEQVEQELKTKVGIAEAVNTPTGLIIKPGRLKNAWNANCLAVGQAMGVLEPMEASNILMVQQTVARFIDSYTRARSADIARKDVNEKITFLYDATAGYLSLHYLFSDLTHWSNRNINLEQMPEFIQNITEAWKSGADFTAELRRMNLEKVLPVHSWYTIFSGMGVFSDASKLQAPNDSKIASETAKIDDFIRRCAMNYGDHRDYISRMLDIASGTGQ